MNRRDLRCPFGCRVAHRQRCSTARSVAYYRTRGGRLKKRLQNNKRRKSQPTQPGEPVVEQEVGAPEAEASKQHSEATQDGAGFDGDMLCYLRMLLSLIEGRKVTRDEIVQLLNANLRQHSMARRTSGDYLLWYLNENPP